LVNYGCLPQTWEDPKHKDARTGYLGDNDPVDVCEVGSRVALTGEVYPVKVVGVLGMIDEGEMDYKLLCIAKDDPMASSINSVSDLERLMPGKIQKIVNWFKYYKVPDGKPVNSFAFDEKAKDADFAATIVEETHTHWKNKENMKKAGLWVD
jgi:inorganic pyrophosphatase